ncbi:MAG: hypothetical protein AAGC56_01080 [Pseudomonadota bacterium]
MNLAQFPTESIWLAGAGIFLLGILIGVVFSRVPGRNLRLLHALFRILTWPVRRIGLLGRTARTVRGVRNVAVSGGASVSILERKTEIERAIFLQRAGLEAAGGVVGLDEDQIRDLEQKSKDLEDAYIVTSKGFLYDRIFVAPSYTPSWVEDGLAPHVVERFAHEADGFFNGQVDLNANAGALYEENDGAHTIYMFGKSDLAAYNLIDKTRKTVNENALKLIVSFLACILTAFGVVLFATKASTASIFVLAAAAGLMALSAFAYKNMQEHSIRSLGKFMTLYVGYISDHFREAAGKAKSVHVGVEKDAAVLSARAQVWNKTMVWTAFRSFFIETFLRNQLYQIRRNSEYYRLFSDFMIVATPIAVALGHYLGAYDIAAYASGTGYAVAFGAAFLVVFYVLLVRMRVITAELDLQDWRGFDTLRLGEKMDEVVGKYVEEIGYWKQRFDR